MTLLNSDTTYHQWWFQKFLYGGWVGEVSDSPNKAYFNESLHIVYNQPIKFFRKRGRAHCIHHFGHPIRNGNLCSVDFVIIVLRLY